MNIRDWPLGRIMQLPDCCFGQRFIISARPTIDGINVVWDISEVAVPERFILWEVVVYPNLTYLQTCNIRIAWGDALPTTTAQMDELEPVLRGVGPQGAAPRQIFVGGATVLRLARLKIFVQASGRRLIVESTGEVGFLGLPKVIIVVSSVPTEVPDCLLSAHR